MLLLWSLQLFLQSFAVIMPVLRTLVTPVGGISRPFRLRAGKGFFYGKCLILKAQTALDGSGGNHLKLLQITPFFTVPAVVSAVVFSKCRCLGDPIRVNRAGGSAAGSLPPLLRRQGLKIASSVIVRLINQHLGVLVMIAGDLFIVP